MINQKLKWGALATATTLLITGCAGMDSNPALDEARIAVSAAERDPVVAASAAEELERAREALAMAEATFAEEGDNAPELLAHQAYLAQTLAELAQTEGRTASLTERIEGAEAERSQVLLTARTREAEAAERRAEQQTQQAQTAQRQAQTAQQQAANAETRANLAENSAAASAAAAELLRQRIDELEMQETERGLVLTLDDVLFGFDKTELQPGAGPTLDRLADFLTEYPERVVLIEGHTDSTGTDAYNETLSQRRANAVRDALMDRGLAAARVQTRGIGEAQPVASNSTEAGRQQNRRVEVVISDTNGQIPPAASAAAASR